MTPIEKYDELAKAIGLKELYFKREDMHPYGSHKGRSIPVMIDYYLENGDKKFAITGSGNAALAAALHTIKLNNDGTKMELVIFTGKHINDNKLTKLKKLENKNIEILSKERPLQALQQAVSEGYRSLRQSTDDIALLGYKSLAEEIEGIKNVAAIFVGTSSGTTAQALAQHYSSSDGKAKKIQVHIIQTSSCHPIAQSLGANEFNEERSIADAIVDQTALRKAALIPLIEKTGGKGWIASNSEIEEARRLTREKTSLEISTNSALSVVGATKAAYDGNIDGAAVCLICGD